MEKLPQATPQEKPSLPLEGRSILWVDDRPSANSYERNYLKELGASITQSLSTQDAKAKVDEASFDLIISDVGRKEGERHNLRAGYDLLNELMDRRPRIPVVFYTTSARTKLRQPEVVDYGAYVTDRPADLVDTVVHLLGR
jgi:CheY-like chemotaxis protein